MDASAKLVIAQYDNKIRIERVQQMHNRKKKSGDQQWENIKAENVKEKDQD